jgi:hypothetical protein
LADALDGVWRALGFEAAVPDRAFKGNTAETKTILPVAAGFAAERGLEHLTVVADAAMLAESNLLALEDAGFFFIVGSRIDKVPWKVAEFARAYPGEPVVDGQVFVEPRPAGTKRTGPRRWAVVYQYRQARAERDLRNIAKQVAKAQAVVDGLRPVKRAQFVVLGEQAATLNEPLIAAARARAGIKGYITNLPVRGLPPAPGGSAYRPPCERDPVDPLTVVSHYHQLFEVEASFRISKADIKARPMCVHSRPSIEAHLTGVRRPGGVPRHPTRHRGANPPVRAHATPRPHRRGRHRRRPRHRAPNRARRRRAHPRIAPKRQHHMCHLGDRSQVSASVIVSGARSRQPA